MQTSIELSKEAKRWLMTVFYFQFSCMMVELGYTIINTVNNVTQIHLVWDTWNMSAVKQVETESETDQQWMTV